MHIYARIFLTPTLGSFIDVPQQAVAIAPGMIFLVWLKRNDVKKHSSGRYVGVKQTHFVSHLLYFDSINHYFLLERGVLEASCEEIWMEKKRGGLILLAGIDWRVLITDYSSHVKTSITAQGLAYGLPWSLFRTSCAQSELSFSCY